MKRAVATILLLLVVFGPVFASADTIQSRPIESLYSLTAGYSRHLHTYMSPLRYRGPEIALEGRWMKALPASPEKLRMEFDARLSAATATTAHGSMRGYDASLRFGWSLLHAWRVTPSLILSAGGGPSLEAGVFYLPANGNNPASARARLGIDLRFTATYSLRLGRLPARLVEEVTLPAIAAFFMPQYGESYYEIWLGNRTGLAHCAWWGNHFGIINFAGIDLRFSRGTLRVGYEYTFRNAEANNLIGRSSGYALSVGYSPAGRCRNCPDKKAEVTYATY